MQDIMMEIQLGERAFGLAQNFTPFQIWVVRNDCTMVSVPYLSIGPSDGNHRGRIILNCRPHSLVEIIGQNLMPIHDAIQRNFGYTPERLCTFQAGYADD